MIFKQIMELQSNADRSYYKEKIDLFINSVTALEKHFCTEKCSTDLIKATEKLIEMGIICDDNQLDNLSSLIGKDTFAELMNKATSYAINDKLFGEHLVKFSNARRKELQEIDENRIAPTMVDLFCGAGGLGFGFQSSGFKTVFANDFDRLCIETYKFNHPEIPSEKVYCGDIKDIADNISAYIDRPVDIVIGGPPCQGFSSANKHHRVIDDPRNELYKYFLKAVRELKPKAVVMENVKGMLRVADQVVEDYSNIQIEVDGHNCTYNVSYKLLNSMDFSVAQSRERLIYIALRSDISEEKNLTPDALFDMIKAGNKGKAVYNLDSALQGLKSLTPPHIMNVGEKDTEEAGRKVDSNEFKGNENEYLKLINGNRTLPLVMNHKARYCSELNYEIYKRMQPGDDATDAKIADIMPYASRNDKFKDKYYRLYGDRPCRTITAHLRADCHSHIHPHEDRALTPREAARAQSFPDDYMFLGPYLLTYKQIGNAVPVIMAKEIAKVIKYAVMEDHDVSTELY